MRVTHPGWAKLLTQVWMGTMLMLILEELIVSAIKEALAWIEDDNESLPVREVKEVEIVES